MQGKAEFCYAEFMKTILKYYVRVMMFLMPLFFLPVVTDPWGFGKNWLLIGSMLIGLVLWVVTMISNKDGVAWSNRVLGLVVLLGLWATVTFLRMEPGVKMRSILTLGGWGTMMGLVGWFWLWLQVADEEENKKQVNWLTAAGLIVVVSSLVVFLIPSVKLPIIWPKNSPIITINSSFSLTGSLLVELMLGGFLVLEWLGRLIVKIKKGGTGYIMEAVITAILVLGVVLDGFRLIKTGWAIVDNTTAWVVAVEVFKRSPLWGVGIGNFVEAFSSYRPASYNLTAYWSSVFGGSRYGILQVWTEIGLIGLGLVILMIMKVMGEKKKSWQWWQIMIVWLMFLLTPLTWAGWWLVVWLMASRVLEKKRMGLVLKVGENGFNAAPWIMGLVLVGMSVAGGWWWVRILRGEIVMRGAMVAAAKNDGSKTYNEEIKAIGANPWYAEYRKVYSQTNLALAKSILSNKEITDEEKQKAAVLVEQAVREGKSAVALDTRNSDYWSNLAVLYRDLIGVVDGAADWSYQAYTQAVALEPTNPLLRLELGGLLYAANRMEEADRVFEVVVSDKGDYANGWYNWAHTAKNLGKLDVAVQRLAQAVALVPVDSGDYETASKELVSWRKELEEALKRQQAAQQAAATKQAETLKTAEPLPTGSPEEKVNVPKEELEPPKVTITPTVIPTITPEP